MISMNGNLVLNGVRDQELVKILEVKVRHEGNLNFNPQQTQVGYVQVPQQARPGQPSKQEQVYSNVVLQWSNEQGLEAVQEIVHFLLKKEEAAKAVGQ